jgi:hypothetical protein
MDRCVQSRARKCGVWSCYRPTDRPAVYSSSRNGMSGQDTVRPCNVLEGKHSYGIVTWIGWSKADTNVF